MELVGLVGDGENDLRTEGTGREHCPHASRQKPGLWAEGWLPGAPDQPAPDAELETRAVDKAESAQIKLLASGPLGLPGFPRGRPEIGSGEGGQQGEAQCVGRGLFNTCVPRG